MEEMNVYSEKVRREAKQELWPEEIDGKIGMFCEDCGLTIYSKLYKIILKVRCPRCKSSRWYFVTEDWQPKQQYHSEPPKICKECGSSVFGAMVECPECRGRLRLQK